MIRLYFTFIFLFIFKIAFTQQGFTINLNSSWQFNYKNTWYNTSAPNSIHTDLLNNKLIDNPFYRDNESRLQWIGEQNWEYKKEFDVDSSMTGKQVVEIVFKGLDTYADVFLNDSLILQSDNMFREWKVNCKKILRPGNNSLQVIFYSAEKKSKQLYESSSVKKLPGEERVMTRKAQYHFGWDFAPRFITCGMWKEVELVAWDYFKIENISFQTDSLKNDAAYITASTNIQSTEISPLLISVTDKNSGLKIVSAQTEIENGENNLQFQFTIENPKLWWCNGKGEPYLYNLSIEVTDTNGNKDVREAKAGIRTVKVVQQPDAKGKSFYFSINNKPVFMKGANYIPQDVFLNRVADENYRLLLQAVKDAGMNMLRVWGGGIYEKEKFYDLCDEYGILVWQDFMFACGMYPFDSTFLQNVKEEAEQQVKRLSYHPCIALWCGNNENSEGWHRWGWQDNYSEKERAEIWNGYQKLFNDILPTAVKKYSNTFYWETSPKFGRGDERHTKEGDAHNWFVWHDGEPFENYEQKVPRFMSEFGFQSLPEMRTIKSFCPDSELHFSSAAIKAHQKHSRGFEIIHSYMKKKYGAVPASFEEYVTQSQQLQSDGICTGIKAHIGTKPDDTSGCMGTLFWQLNDCWPCISWSAIDYYGRRKKLYNEVKKIFLQNQ